MSSWTRKACCKLAWDDLSWWSANEFCCCKPRSNEVVEDIAGDITKNIFITKWKLLGSNKERSTAYLINNKLHKINVTSYVFFDLSTNLIRKLTRQET